MSASGQSRQFDLLSVTSALPRTSDVSGSGRHFAFVPSTDDVRSQSPQLFLTPQQTSRTRSLTFMNGWMGTFGVAILEVGSCPLPVPCLEVILDSTQHIVGATQDRLGIQRGRQFSDTIRWISR